MKLLMLSVAMACQAFAFASQGVSQQQNPQPERPYLIHRAYATVLLDAAYGKHRTHPVGSIKRSIHLEPRAESNQCGNRIGPPAKRKRRGDDVRAITARL